MNGAIIKCITVIRILFGVLFFHFTFFDFNWLYLLIIFSLTVISDLGDGFLARKYDLTSKNGAKLDVCCDFSFIFLSTLAVVLIDLIPFWFLFVIILKLIEFFKTSGTDDLKYEKFGHTVALMFYVFPIMAIIINSKNIIFILTIIITICAILSSLLRIKNYKLSW